MGYCIISLLTGLAWLIAAALSAIEGDISTTVLLALMGGLFLYAAYKRWKKLKESKKD